MQDHLGKKVEIKRSDSLSYSTVMVAGVSCIMLGVIALVLGLGLYGKAVADQYITRAFDLAKTASVSATHGANSIQLAEDVMDIYYSLDEQQRQKCGSDEYLSYFADIDTSSGSDHRVLYHMLQNYIQTDVFSDVYIAMFDDVNNALVYIVDPEEENQFQVGEWEQLEKREVNKYLGWDGQDMLYDISKTERYGWLCTAGYPIRNDQGETVCFVLADVGINTVIRSMIDFAGRISLAMLLFTGLITWILMRHMKNRIVAPINKITDAAEKYAEDKRAGATNTDHFVNLDIHTKDELENLSNVMAYMEHDLSEYEQELMKVATEKERMNTELKMASLIQSSTLPTKFPPYPERTEFDLFASMDPAREVGGDFYDFYLIDDDHLCIVMADVSGKGIPGALFMMISKVIVQSCAMLGLKTAEILNKTNEALCSNNKVDMFVTVWLGILEISTGKITAANAGHEYPFVNSDGHYEVLNDHHGLVIGGMPETKYEEYTIQLKPGDSIFLYTDGIPEANDPDQKFFGMDRLKEALNRRPDASCEETVSIVKEAVDEFVKDADQFDDQTMLCFRYYGK